LYSRLTCCDRRGVWDRRQMQVEVEQASVDVIDGR
jgi:hypothetical protein